jgi:flavodoxin
VNILIVYGSQYGNTQRIAQEMARALTVDHDVLIAHAPAAQTTTADDIDLLIVGAPTQMRGHRNLADPFLAGLEERGFGGVATAAFDTRLPDLTQRTGAMVIADRLERAGCRLVAPPTGFYVRGLDGPLADGEEARAARWAADVAAGAALTARANQERSPRVPGRR